MLSFLSILFSRMRRSRAVVSDVNLRKQVRVSALILLLVIGAHATAMYFLEGLSPFEALWLTTTTMTTVGYGDISPGTVAGRLLTIFLIYFMGVFLLARLASLSFEARAERRHDMLCGQWRWHMRDHILIINAPYTGASRYLERLIGHIRADPAYARVSIQILTEDFPEGLPEAIRDLDVALYTGSPHDLRALEAVDVRHARHVLVLAPNAESLESDSLNFDILHRMRELYTGARILVEAVDDSNRERFRRFGAHIIMRPVRAYPEMTVRAMDAPGIEAVFEDLLTPEGNLTRRFNLRIRGCRWGDIVHTLMDSGYGTALAYIDDERQIVTNPLPNARVTGRGLIMSVRREQIPHRAEVQAAVQKLASAA